jgi:hypothetical protein
MPGVDPDWKFWLDLEEDEQTKELRPPKDGLYVIGVDVSGGVSEPRRVSRPSTRSRSSTTGPGAGGRVLIPCRPPLLASTSS